MIIELSNKKLVNRNIYTVETVQKLYFYRILFLFSILSFSIIKAYRQYRLSKEMRRIKVE